ncbi:unnamed protein product [Ceratitis capitata]|uniref:(Mediterranean fruit fly) hypothetical protein n=1 Tax=Ceratitis capitata TaxID=7213 RepID=A0A811UHX6_CERCA|nr:unnamed protein product [Ceratitis capitata]
MSREPSNQFEPVSNFGSNLCDEKWKGWCRLCAKADEYCVNVISGVYQKFPNDTGFNYDVNLAYLIAKYFQIQIQEDEKLSRVICLECCKYITALSKFGERVSNVQQMYDELYKCKDKTKFDVDSLLEKYNLSKNESVLAHHENEVPIEEIFVAGLAVTVETDPTIVNIKKEAVTVAEQIDTTLPVHNEDDDDPIGDKEQDKEESCTQLDSDISSSSEENYSDDNATSSTNIRKRLQKNSGENLEKHTCIICSQCFQRRRNYATHMKRKHDVIVCPECPSSFKNILNLKKHILEHRNAFNCSQCEQKFEKKSILSKHVKDVHRKPVGKFVCEACGEAMVTKRELTLHMLIHTDYIPFKCKDCGMCFKEKYRFKVKNIVLFF